MHAPEENPPCNEIFRNQDITLTLETDTFSQTIFRKVNFQNNTSSVNRKLPIHNTLKYKNFKVLLLFCFPFFLPLGNC